MNDQNSIQVDLLLSLGFKEYNENNYDHFQPDIDIYEYERLFIEEDMCRQRIYVKIDIEDYFSVYVLENVGCGSILMPFLWSDLDAIWLTHLKMSLCLHGFLKDGVEIKYLP